jgi:fructose-1,6-bisphosphatase/inositol monophosphatase family enzyme
MVTMMNDFERNCIDEYRSQGGDALSRRTDDANAWVAFGISLLLEAGRMVRSKRQSLTEDSVVDKEDGSPATLLESEIENLMRDRLGHFDPEAVAMGEETGGTLAPTGVTVAIDPIDGTRAFLSGVPTYVTSLAVFCDGNPIAGLVSNPSTGEIAYATKRQSRLIQLSLFGEGDYARALPLNRPVGNVVLVSLHPSRSAQAAMHELYEAWQRKDVRLVRSQGGAPSWGLLEAAKGGSVYVNMWTGRPSSAFDLAAAVMIVVSAGGKVIDLEGQPIDALTHEGPFLAGLDSRALSVVSDIVRTAIGNR